MSEFGVMDEAMKSLRDLAAERKAFQEEAQEKEAQAERRHQEALKSKSEELRAKDDALKALDEAVTKARHELREAKEAVEDLIAKLKSMEELNQADLKMTANLTVEVKELRDSEDQTQKKAKRDELLAPVMHRPLHQTLR
ncbi:uncharacterized protein LOC133034561 [Cannabis sativa]|uniref:uncharacterized protein LOC133034561 n=1 Tax=Cannabis sativa TaxID=3483 RepID=UPI0029C9D19D|nr:uncharacterized protein LOC133034561 [Cannabis sativa]